MSPFRLSSGKIKGKKFEEWDPPKVLEKVMGTFMEYLEDARGGNFFNFLICSHKFDN